MTFEVCRRVKDLEYQLVPGIALLIDDEARTQKPIKIDAKVCKTAKYTDCLRWINGEVFAEFRLAETMLGQPIKAREQRQKRSRLTE